MKPKTTKTARPEPPEELEGEALLEWGRICDELAAAGRLDKTDRAILVLYVEQWSGFRAATRGVTKHGAVIKFSNKNLGLSPFFKAQKEYAKALRGLLADMGLNPTARGKGTDEPEDEDLSF